jgi:hypothetical protein
MAEQKYVSDELTHFIGRGLKTEEQQFRLLIEILRTGWLRASYRVDFGAGLTIMGDTSKPLTTNEAVRATAVCFCDIPLNDLKIHMAKYGRFGLAFAKQYMLSRGASPVFYVAADAAPHPLPGIGPRTLGEQFNLLYRDLTTLFFQMDQYAFARNPQGTGGLRVTFKLAPEETPEELKILGKLNALISDLDRMVFSQLKFFEGRLPADHENNYYMEREWRKMDGLAFQLQNVRRIILPVRFAPEFRERFPAYTGDIQVIED